MSFYRNFIFAAFFIFHLFFYWFLFDINQFIWIHSVIKTDGVFQRRIKIWQKRYQFIVGEIPTSFKTPARKSDKYYAERLTKIIVQGTAHIHWENWILHLMGRYSGIGEFEYRQRTGIPSEPIRFALASFHAEEVSILCL